MGVRVREKVKGSGEWWVFVNHKGQRQSKKVGSKVTANKVKKGIEEEIARGEWGTEQSDLPTLAVQGQKFIDSPLRDWSPKTLREYQRSFNNHIKPLLGNKPIDKIEIKDVKKMLAVIKGKDLSTSTAKRALSVLRSIFEDAREDGLVESNPCYGMSKYTKSKNGRTRDANPLNAEEVVQLLEKAQTLPIVLRTFILVAVRTGLRLGELLALEWTDVDFDKSTLEVNKGFDYHYKQIINTKTGTTREVRLTPQSLEGLKELHRAGICKKVVFCDENGDRLSDKVIRRWLEVVAPKRITPHDLRHSYASLRLSKGDNVVDVSEQLGHSNVQTTLREYTHWLPRDEYIHQTNELDTLHLTRTPTAPKPVKQHGLH